MEQNGTSQQGLTAKQLRAIECLLRESTTQAAAEAAGVGKTTIFRWLNEPEFAAAYRQARDQMYEGALNGLQAASADAVRALRDVVNDKTAMASARVSAAAKVLDLSLKVREQFEIEERLRLLEERLAQSPGKG